MTAQSTTGITRGLAKMAVTTRSQAQRQTLDGRTKPTPRSGNRSNLDERMHGTSESSSGDEGRGNDNEEEDNDGNGTEESDEGDMNDEDEESSFITSVASKIRYNVTNFSEEEHMRVSIGISPNPEQSPMSMGHCDHPPSSPDTYRFHINDRVMVVFGAEGSNIERPRCTCRVVQRDQTCKHIYWLEDQLLMTYHGPGKIIAPSSGGSLINGVAPANAVTTTGTLEGLARQRHWVFGGERPSDEEIERLVSAFRRGSPSLSGQQVFLTAYDAFWNILLQHAKEDRSLSLKLRSVLTPEFSAMALFSGLLSGLGIAFEELQNQVQADPSGLSLDENVQQCARTLRNLVGQAHTAFIDYGLQDPEMIVPAQDGVGALVEMLERVANSNRRMYGDSEDHASRLSSQDAEVANKLYQSLIGTADQRGLSPPVNGLFVVGVLKAITNAHPALLQNNVDRMEKIIKLVRQKGAPSAFLSALESLPLRKRGTS